MNPTEVFSPQEIQEFRNMGYSDQDVQRAINEAQVEVSKQSNLQQSYLQAQQLKSKDPRSFASNSFIAGGYSDNLIQWQLELDTILERIEHMLRGDKPTWTNGSIIWSKPEETYLLKMEELPEDLSKEEEKIVKTINYKIGLDLKTISKQTGFTEMQLRLILCKLEKKKIIKVEDNIIFNERGVAEIMRLLSNYVNRNTILSNYGEDIINEKMLDLGNEVTDLIYLKYEDFGLNNLEKRKLFPIIVRQLVDICHSSYLRALHGEERESLREARTVNQNEVFPNGGININTGMANKERGLLNPMRWFGGKYK